MMSLSSMKRSNLFVLALVLITGIATASLSKAQNWAADPGHSSVQFSVRHIVTPFVGRFDTYKVDVVLDEEDLKNSSVVATIDPKSINTFSEGRDKHISSEEFFDVENAPEEWRFEGHPQ